jgi:hypothetical protein
MFRGYWQFLHIAHIIQRVADTLYPLSDGIDYPSEQLPEDIG